MRSNIVRMALAASLICSVSPAAVGDEASLPLRKSGKWEMTTSMDEGNGPREQTLVMCIDSVKEHLTALASVREHKAACEKYEIVREGAKTRVESNCKYAVDSVTSVTEMEGDFQSAFSVKIVSKTVTAVPNRQSIVRNRTILQSGKRLDDSCGDLEPGQAMGADGKRIAVQ